MNSDTCDAIDVCHGFGVFDEAVFSWLDDGTEEHGLTEDGKTVAPDSVSKYSVLRDCSFAFKVPMFPR